MRSNPPTHVQLAAHENPVFSALCELFISVGLPCISDSAFIGLKDCVGSLRREVFRTFLRARAFCLGVTRAVLFGITAV